MTTIPAAKVRRLNDSFSSSSVLALVTSDLSAFTFTADAGTDTLAAAHDFVNGTPVSVSNVSGGLPEGLTASTVYFVINSVAGVSVQLASSIGGTAVDITSVGSGTHTITERAIANLTNLYTDASMVWNVMVRHEVPSYQGDSRKTITWGAAEFGTVAGTAILPSQTISIIPILDSITYFYYVILLGANTTQGDSTGSVEDINIGSDSIILKNQGQDFKIDPVYP